MKLIPTEIEDVKIIEPDVFGDNRGWFTETYNKEKFHELGITNDFVQDNMSFSAKRGTLRGLHYQCYPYSQAKLVRCVKGTVIDVAVDIRKGSPTYGKWVSCELSEENKRMFFIPQGFAHGFVTISDDVIFQYKCDNLYNKASEGGIRYDDETIGVDWKRFISVDEMILSEKDKIAPALSGCNANFIYKENC